MTGHPFDRPPLIRRDLPPFDACLKCGQPEAEHGAWQVSIRSGDDTTLYVVHAPDELTAAAIAGSAHGGAVDRAEVAPWTTP